MSSRHRERDMRSAYQGSYYNYLNTPKTIYSAGLLGTREWCDDHIGEWEADNAFYLKKWDTFIPYLDGTLWSGSTKLREFVQFPISYQVSPQSSQAYYVGPTSAQLVDRAWEILAKTNPATPHVSLPTWFGELKDIPSLVKAWWPKTLKVILAEGKLRQWRKLSLPPGRSRLRLSVSTLIGQIIHAMQLVAKGHVTWRWAVKPMLKDLRAMFSFYEAVEQRFEWLRRLAETKSLKRRVRLGTRDGSSSRNITLHSAGATVTAKAVTLYTEEVWGTARWKLIDSSSIPIDVESRYELAQRLVLGITGWETLATAWELIPWSWLYDWFLKVGDVIAATNNTIGVWPEGVCLMRKLSSRTTYQNISKPTWVSLSGRIGEDETVKLRYPCLALALGERDVSSPCLPLLKKEQWSILASLAVLRGKVPKR